MTKNEKDIKKLKIKLNYDKIRLLRMIEKTEDVIIRMSEK